MVSGNFVSADTDLAVSVVSSTGVISVAGLTIWTFKVVR